MSARRWLVTAGALVLAAAGAGALVQPRADEAPRLVEQVVETGAPGVLVHVRDRGKTRTIVLGVAQDTPRRLVHGERPLPHRPPSHQGIVTGPPRDTSGEAAWWTWGAAAIVSTADDLRRFFDALLRGQLLAPAQLRDMTTLVPAGSLRYGLGLAVFPTPCGDAWGHTGNAQGTITVAWSTRDASRHLIVVVNTYPLTGELEDAVRRLQLRAFCGMVD